MLNDARPGSRTDLREKPRRPLTFTFLSQIRIIKWKQFAMTTKVGFGRERYGGLSGIVAVGCLSNNVCYVPGFPIYCCVPFNYY